MKNLLKVRSIVAIIMVTAIAILAFAGCGEKSGSPETSASISTVENQATSTSVDSSSNDGNESNLDSREEGSSDLEDSSSIDSFISDTEQSLATSTVESNSENSDVEEALTASIDDTIGFCKGLEDFEVTYIYNDKEFTEKFYKDSYFYVYKVTDSKVYIYELGLVFPVSKDNVEILSDDFTQDFTSQHWVF